MEPRYPVAFTASNDDLNLLGVIHPGEVLTLRTLQADLERLRSLLPQVRLSARESQGIAFALPILGFGTDTEEEVFRQFNFDFATGDAHEERPAVLYLTSRERSRRFLSGQDACRLILEPDQPIMAGTLKSFIEDLGISFPSFEPEGPYLAIHDGSSQMFSDLRRRNRVQPRYQPCELRLMCEMLKGNICAVRIEVVAEGDFQLRAGHAVAGIQRVSKRNGVAYGWVEPASTTDLLWDYLGEGKLWTTAIAFAKAMGFHPENLEELELVIDDQRTWTYQPSAISDRV